MPARGCLIGHGETAARKHHESETLGGGRIAARQSRARTAGGGCMECGGAGTGRGTCALRGAARGTAQIGRASCRERVEIAVGAVALKKKKRYVGEEAQETHTRD